MSPARTLALSDSTFAVAMTLLIFDVRFSGPTNGVAADLWFHQWPHYLGYVVSFVVVGMLWMNHHAIFRLAARLDHTQMVLNLALLGVVVFIPFPTQVVAAYLQAGDKERVFVTVFYGLTMALATLMLAVLWHHAARRRRLLEPWIPQQRVNQLTWRLYITPLLFVAATALSVLYAKLGLALYLVIACGYLLHTGTRVVPRHPESDPAATAKDYAE